jgi:hypothetical protein
MTMWQFLMIVALVGWIIRRLPTPCVTDMYLRRIFHQVNVIEARDRGVPREEIEKELSDYIGTRTAIHDGTPLLLRMWR